MTDLYFVSAVAASRRDYHSLLFDGPGQGNMLFEHGLHLRPDWENVVRPVLDVAKGLSTVDPERIALSGWSLGGYLAPRAGLGRAAARCVDAHGTNVRTGPCEALDAAGGHCKMANRSLLKRRVLAWLDEVMAS